MRYGLLLSLVVAGSLSPLASAFAHFGIGDDENGHQLLWVYGILLSTLAGFIVYRKWLGGKETPERRELKRHLSELERAHAACLTQLQNAEDYPKECGLTEEQRRERLDSVASFEGMIKQAHADLAAS